MTTTTPTVPRPAGPLTQRSRPAGASVGTPVAPAGYVLRVGPVDYTHDKQGRPIPLADMVRWARGVGACTLTRADGTVVVENLGGGHGYLTHVPTGTKLRPDVPQTWPVRRLLATLARRPAHGLAA